MSEELKRAVFDKCISTKVLYGNKRTKERLEGAKMMFAIYYDERIDSIIIRETQTTTVATSQGARKLPLPVPNALTAKEEHCPVVMYPGEVYIKTVKLAKRRRKGSAPWREVAQSLRGIGLKGFTDDH